MPDLLIFDPYDNLVAILSNEAEATCPFWSAPYKEILNNGSTFQFTAPADHEDSQYLVAENQVAFEDKDGKFQLFVIKEPEETNGVNGPAVTCVCEPWINELNDEPIEDVRPYNTTLKDALTRLLAKTRVKVGEVAELGLNSTNAYYTSVAEGVHNCINTWGGELSPRIDLNAEGNKIAERILDVPARRGADTGKIWEIDKDILSLSHKVQSYPKTALYGRGASLETDDGGFTRKITFADVEWKAVNGDPVDKPKGQEWVGDPGALASFGRLNVDGSLRHRFGFYENGEQDDPAILLRETWETLQLQKRQFHNYEMDVFLLEEITGHEHEKVRLGDTTFAIDRSFANPIEVEERVISYEYDVADPDNSGVVELGQYIPLFDDTDERIDKIESRLNDRGRIWDKVEQPVQDSDFPDIIPEQPVNVVATGAFKKVLIEWDFTPAIYVANYEVYGSQIAGFSTDQSNLLWRGKVGSFGHEADVNQQWYYRVRAVNTHGKAGPFSQEVSATTARIITDDIMFGAVNAQILADLAVEAAKLANGAVINSKLGSLSVSSDKLDNSAVTQMKIADLSVTNGKIDNLAVTNAKIADATITGAKIGSATIDTANIKDAAITTAKIGLAQIDTANIKDASITSAKIGTGQITTALIANAAITETLIKDASITDAKIVSLSANKMTTGTLDASKVNVTNLVADNIVTGTITIASANLFMNSDYKNDIWKADSTLYAVRSVVLAPDPINDYFLHTENTGTGEKFAYLERVALKESQEVTISFWAQCDAGHKGADVFLLSSTSLDATEANKRHTGFTTVHHIPITADGNWYKYVKTFIMPAGTKSGYVRLDNNGVNVVGTGIVNKSRFSPIMVQYGKLATKWQPHTNELLAEKGITNLQIGDYAIDNRVITANTITGDKLVVDAITTREIKAGSITAASGIIADATIGTAKIIDGAITTAKIGDAQITNAKIVNLDASKITTGYLDAARVKIGANTSFESGYDPTMAPINAGKVFYDVASYNFSTGTQTGALVIETPITFGSYMAKVNIKGYLYNSGTGTDIDVTIDFYAYSAGTYHNYSFTSRGSRQVDAVKIAKNASGKVVIILGSTTDKWDYPHIRIPEVAITYTTPPDSFKTGWSMSVKNDLSTYTYQTNVTGRELNESHNLTMLWRYPNTTYINGGDIYTNSITANQIASGTITANSGIISDAAITTAMIANLAVGNGAIANAAITNAKIGNLAVSTAQIQDLAITNAKIGNLAVDDAKISNVSVSKLKAGTIDANTISIGNSKINLNSNGLYVYKNSVLGASLVEGNLTFNDQSTADKIGMFAATVWSDGATKGISMNMEANRYISFGHYVGGTTGYEPMVVFNPGTAMAGVQRGINANIPYRANDDVWMGTKSVRFGENNNHNHSSIWHDSADFLALGSYTGVKLGYLTTGGVMNDRLTVDSNSVDAWQDLDMHGWKILRVGELQYNSNEYLKTDIGVWETSALEKINAATIYDYKLKQDLEKDIVRCRQGLVIGEGYDTPSEFIDQNFIDVYQMTSWAWKAIQELTQKVTELEQKIA